MKTVRILSLFLCLFVASPQIVYSAQRYVSPTGTGTCQASDPCSLTTGISGAASGDTVNVVAGTYSVGSTISVPAGVSVVGPMVNFSYPSFTTAPTAILTVSASPGFRIGTSGSYTNGLNQQISYLNFVSSGASSGVDIPFRSNVLFHHNRLTGFSVVAMEAHGQSGKGRPSTYPTGLKFYDNVFRDSAGGQGSWTSGAVSIEGTQGAEFYRNLIDNLSMNRRGIGMKNCVYDGYNKGLLVHDNTIQVPENNGGGGGSTWCVALEFWYHEAGCQVYNNRIKGEFNNDTLALAGSSYSIAFYGNEIGYDATPTSLYARALTFDGDVQGLRVYGNYFHHAAGGLFFNPGGTSNVNDLQIYNNIFYAMGQTESGGHQKILCDNGMNYSNVKIYHNTVYVTGGSAAVPYAGWDVQGSNIDVSNNICVGATGGPWLTISTSGGSNYVRNNMLYGNANGNSESGSGSYTKSGNIIADPGILGSGVRQGYYMPSGTGSNLYNAGINVGILTDYAGTVRPQGGAHDIGAFEYTVDSGSTGVPPDKVKNPRSK